MVRTLSLALGLIFLLAVGFLWFAASLPEDVETPEQHTQAIVVLTGGGERVAEGLRLLAEGKGDYLLITGVYRDVTLPEILALEPDLPPELAERIELGYAADDTHGNAVEAATFMTRRELSSLRLVTAAYHMPRSLLEFRRTLPSTLIIAHPVFPQGLDQAHWWNDGDTAEVLLGEYLKYLLALASGPFRSEGR
ncbi:MAG TPA: YdcF family protein [Kiloniellales bacterium]|nr:YdcF family protein [Kiloniellales bacterium]